ncbi:MAG TPA: LacI family DNA-binding transcriptional regulator [Streptosporangiaceae bacterium]|nr:LacI family DNA-binding transcriptional regulator [Streptosporangiaceae bacterium]
MTTDLSRGATADGPVEASAATNAADGSGGTGLRGATVAQPPTIYDVARAAGVSIASVSRVLNGQRNPREETRDRVLQAVAELGFVPDGAARALSVRLKEVVGVVVRRPQLSPTDVFADEDENLQFPDMINRGMEVVAQRYGYDLLIRSVDLHESDGRRIFALARKSDGLILHDQVLSYEQLTRLGRQVPVVTLACVPTPETVNVRSDNEAGIRELVEHLATGHGYDSIAYLSGHLDSPDNVARFKAMTDAATRAGAELVHGPQWQGDYSAAGGARVIDRLLDAGVTLPRAICCANDQTAIGVLHTLAQRRIDVPGRVAVCGFDDIPVARHLNPRLTSVRQPIQDLGATAFETLHAMISPAAPGHDEPRGRDIVLPTRLNCRESCGCHPTVGHLDGPRRAGTDPQA